MDFTVFKKIILDFSAKKIDRATFVKMWRKEQKRQEVVNNAISLD